MNVEKAQWKIVIQIWNTIFVTLIAFQAEYSYIIRVPMIIKLKLTHIKWIWDFSSSMLHASLFHFTFLWCDSCSFHLNMKHTHLQKKKEFGLTAASKKPQNDSVFWMLTRIPLKTDKKNITYVSACMTSLILCSTFLGVEQFQYDVCVFIVQSWFGFMSRYLSHWNSLKKLFARLMWFNTQYVFACFTQSIIKIKKNGMGTRWVKRRARIVPTVIKLKHCLELLEIIYVCNVKTHVSCSYVRALIELKGCCVWHEYGFCLFLFA